MIWREALFVGAGGALGSVLRFLLVVWVQRDPRFATFPMGTLVVNGIGSLILGFLMGTVLARDVLSSSMRVFLVIGLLGGFTTFSTFAFETVALARDGASVPAVANVVLQVVVGLLAAAGGYVLGRAL